MYFERDKFSSAHSSICVFNFFQINQSHIILFIFSSLGSAGAANVAAVIQPRTPAPEYGPPKH